MRVMLRWPHLMGMMLLAAAPFAGAESPLPDPIAPAVIGRPLDQIRPARQVHPKPAATKPNPPKEVAAANAGSCLGGGFAWTGRCRGRRGAGGRDFAARAQAGSR